MKAGSSIAAEGLMPGAMIMRRYLHSTSSTTALLVPSAPVPVEVLIAT